VYHISAHFECNGPRCEIAVAISAASKILPRRGGRHYVSIIDSAGNNRRPSREPIVDSRHGSPYRLLIPIAARRRRAILLKTRAGGGGEGGKGGD